MKIFNQKQLRDWDRFTIENEGISSLQLIEEAGMVLAEEIETQYLFRHPGPVRIFCGMGNNGADGLVIALNLHEFIPDVEVFVIRYRDQGSDEFETLLEVVKEMDVPVHVINSKFDLPELSLDTVVIDAMLGTGISRTVSGLLAEVIEYLNDELFFLKIAIDIPSGMHPDQLLDSTTFIADATFSIGSRKLAGFYRENEDFIGTHIQVPLELSDLYYMKTETPYFVNDLMECALSTPIPSQHAYKNEFGHVLFIGGSYGMMGAARLACEAALRGGCGLVTAHVPACGLQILQTALPEAMVSVDDNEKKVTTLPDLSAYDTICIGCGMGTEVNQRLLEQVLKTTSIPKVIDADALNLLAMHPELMAHLNEDCILTPHVGEFHRLFGNCENSMHRLERLIEQAKKLGCFIVLKGHHTMIASPSGHCYFNETGNPILGTAGSGDVLAGYISGHLARGLDPLLASRRAVSYHGFAGDILQNELGSRGALARDILLALSRIENEIDELMHRSLIDDDDEEEMRSIDLLDNLN